VVVLLARTGSGGYQVFELLWRRRAVDPPIIDKQRRCHVQSKAPTVRLISGNDAARVRFGETACERADIRHSSSSRERNPRVLVDLALIIEKRVMIRLESILARSALAR
jgi:hypothetical protein